MTDIRDRIRAEKNAKKNEEARLEQERQALLTQGNALTREFEERYYPSFKRLIFKLTGEAGYALSETRKEPNCRVELLFRYQIKEGFWGKLFPKEGGWWKFRIGAVYVKEPDWQTKERELIVHAVEFDAFFAGGAKRLLKDVPNDKDKAVEWFNDFLYECYEASKKANRQF